MKRKKDVKWSMQNGKCKRKQPQSISFGDTHHIIPPITTSSIIRRKTKENDNNFFCLFFFLFSTYFITFANLLNYSDTNIHS